MTTNPENLIDEAALLDDHAVDLVAKAMKAKLAVKREQGFGGWHDISQCTGDRLAELLLAAVGKGDPVDVANFAMMLFCRHENHDALKAAFAAALAAPQQELERSSEDAADSAWNLFNKIISDGIDSPYPGMASEFEKYYAQNWDDKSWRKETSVWAAAWKICAARSAVAPMPPAAPALNDDRLAELAEGCMDYESSQFLLRRFIAAVDAERALLAKERP